MRIERSLLPLLCGVLISTAALAQQASETPAPRGSLTRDEFIARAVETAKQRAGERFDAMDTNHDGVLSPEERRAAATARAAARGVPAAPGDAGNPPPQL